MSPSTWTVFGRRIRLHILTTEPSTRPRVTDALEGKSHRKGSFFYADGMN